jgi:hypothetical protein
MAPPERRDTRLKEQPMSDQRPSNAATEPGSGDSEKQAPERLTIPQIIGSTIAAALGVQSSRNRHRDFQAGKPTHFIIAGIVFTVLFVVGMIMLVRLVLSSAA